MHEDVEKLVNAGRITDAVGQKLSTLAPGSFVLHGSWGAGKVSSWDLFGGKVTIDFEKSKEQVMGLKLALQKLESLDAGDLRVQRLESLDELKDLAAEDPGEVVVRLLQASGGRLSPDQIEDELSGTLIDKDLYKKWWDKAKKSLRESKRANVPTKRTEYLTLRDENESPLESLVKELEEALNLKAKIKALTAIKAEEEALKADVSFIERIATQVEVVARKSLRLQGGLTLELLCLRDELIDLVEDYNLPEEGFTIENALQEFSGELAEATSPLASVRQRRIYESFPKAYGDDWVKNLLAIFNNIGTRGVGEIAKLLEEHDKTKDLHKHIKKALSLRTLGPDALSWICRERNKASEKCFSHEVGLAVLNIIESDYLEDGPRKSNKSLMARIIKSYPDMGELVEGTTTKRDKSLIVSWESLDRKKEEYRDLVENRIPQNIKDIAIARSYGDLRENFEYKAAKDMQAVLNRRKNEVAQELSRAKATEFENADTSAINVGTIVTLEGDSGKEVYTILGAWDGDPDKKVLSYKSVVAKGLIGKKVGAKVTVQDFDTEEDRAFTVKSIVPFNKG